MPQSQSAIAGLGLTEQGKVYRRTDPQFDPSVDPERYLRVPAAGPDEDLFGRRVRVAFKRYGGQGAGWTELGIVLEEMGRALVCAPFFSTVVLAATTLLEAADDEAKQDYLPGIADGSVIATVALTEESGCWEEEGVTLPAAHSPDGWTLSGAKHFVLDGTTAQLIIVPARTASGVSLFAVDAASPGLTRKPSVTLDQTRKLAVVEFAGTPARLIGA